MSKEGWVYSLRFTNPYREPPGNLPRLLATWDHEPSLKERLAVYPGYQLGCGFSVCIEFPHKPIKRMDADKKQAMRAKAKKTLEANRVRKQLPLLAAVIIRDEGLDWRASN
jgi:hypothetical protein